MGLCMQEAILSTIDKPVVRFATAYDISQVVDLLGQWTEEAAINVCGTVSPSTGVWVAQMIRDQLVLVVDFDGQVVGTLIVRDHFFPWDERTRVLFMEVLMVNKNYRKTGAGKLLVDCLKGIADKENLAIMLGFSNGTDLDKKDRFIKMCGFTPMGGNYLYGGNYGR